MVNTKIVSVFIMVSSCATGIIAQGTIQQAWINYYQSWVEKNFDYGVEMAVDEDGNVYVAGNSKGSGTALDYVIIKYDSDGVQHWVARYNGPGNRDDDVTALTVDDLGNVYVTGSTSDVNDMTDYTTIKYDKDGNQQWAARYNGPGNFDDDANAIAVDRNGNVYVTGTSMEGAFFPFPAYATVKYNCNGERQWVARYSGPGNLFDVANAIAVDSEGNVYVTGQSYGSGGSLWSKAPGDIATIKYNNKGEQLWVARYNGSANSTDFGIKIAIDSFQNVIVAGISVGSGGKSDFVTLKYNSEGKQQWVVRYDSPEKGQDDIADLAIDESGNVYVTGTVNAEIYSPNSDYMTIKYNSDGIEQWVARYNGQGNQWDRANAVAVDQFGNVYVTGQSIGDGTGSDYATVKYNSDGVEQWVVHYHSIDTKDDGAIDIVVDQSGNLYVTGTSEMGMSGSKITTIKYVQQQKFFPSKKKNKYLISGKLSQNYPNPFNASTNIKYSLTMPGFVELKIFNTSGQEVVGLVNQELAVGNYEVKWNATHCLSGVYFYQLQIDGLVVETKKLILLR